MLMPKRTKYRKQQRGRNKGKATKGGRIDFGEYALCATECGQITSRQIEAARIAISRHVKRGGKIWLRVFPDTPYTKKPAETRMGKGKGNPEGWFMKIKPGRVIFELAGVNKQLAEEAMIRAGHKLPFATRFYAREDIEKGLI